MVVLVDIEKKLSSLNYSLSVVSESSKRITLWNHTGKEIESFVRIKAVLSNSELIESLVNLYHDLLSVAQD